MLRYVIFLIIPIFVFANGGEVDSSDILKRTVNFLLFAGLLYYVLVNKFKVQNFFRNRKSEIADKLNSIQEKLKESKNKKILALEKLEEAKASAKSILSTSEKEGKILLAKMSSDLDLEIENLTRVHNDQMDIERRKMVRQVVSEVLDELFDSSSINIDRDKLVNIVMKKVA